MHAADPEVTETIKRTKQPYFTLHGNICARLRAKDHLTIFIYDPIAPDPEGMINQGQGNLTARAIQVRQDEPINTRALLNLFQAIIANNRAGGWRKLKGSRVSIPLAMQCSRRVSGFSPVNHGQPVLYPLFALITPK